MGIENNTIALDKESTTEQEQHTQIWQTGLIISHTACLKHLTHQMEMVITQTTLTKQLKLEDMHITPHHSE